MFDAFKRVRLLTAESVREVLVYNRWFQLCLVSLIIFVLGLQSLVHLPLGASSAKLIFDLGQGGILLSFGIILIVTVAHQQFDDLASGISPMYLVRAVRRWEYLLGKVLGVWLSIVFSGGLAVLVLSYLVRRNLQQLMEQSLGVSVPNWSVWFQIWCYHAAQWWVLASVVTFLGMFSRSFLFPVALGLLVWLTSMLAHGMAAFMETSVGQEGRIWEWVAWLLPRFDLSRVQGQLWYDGGYDLAGWMFLLLINLLYSALFFVASIFLFQRRSL